MKTKNTQKLFELIKTGIYDPKEAIKLIKKGINPDFKVKGWNMLHFAVQKGGDIEVVKYLIKNKVDANDTIKINKEKLTVLEYYVYPERVKYFKCKKEIIKLLTKND